jgi:hypothetical protein
MRKSSRQCDGIAGHCASSVLPTLAVVLALVAVTAGCSKRPTRVPVSGQVLLDGKPLPSGFVRLVPTNARPSTGRIDREGRFQLTTFAAADGSVPGTHGVSVIAYDESNPNELHWLVPRKYADASTSGLKVTITGPTDSLKIELSGEGEELEVDVFHNEGDSDPSKW